MQNKTSLLPPAAILCIFAVAFIILGLLIYTGEGSSTDCRLLMAGNVVLFISTTLSFYLCRRALGHSNPHAFVRMVYSGMLIKMGICIIAALAYVFISANNVSRIVILGFFILYCIYTFTEVKILMRLSKEQKNG